VQVQGGGLRRKVALITACGGKKEEKPAVAGRLYKSARIRHLYRRSKELKVPFFVLSAKYGLVRGDQVIEPYEAVMDSKRCRELKRQIVEVLKAFDAIVYFKGGARKDYYECLREAAEEAGVEFYSFGRGNMGEIGKLEEVLREVGFVLPGERGVPKSS